VNVCAVDPENEIDDTEAMTAPLGALVGVLVGRGPIAGATYAGVQPGSSVAAETQSNDAMTIRHRFIGLSKNNNTSKFSVKTVE
jgi:hypothetical protein